MSEMMRKIGLTLVALGLMAAATDQARAGIVLNYQNSLQPTTPAPGWSYLYNATGPIGSPTGYAALVATTDPNIYYDISGSNTLPTGPGGQYYTFLGKDGIGHPGLGSSQAAYEGFAIAAYTLSSAWDKVTITGGNLENTDDSLDGLSLQIYLNSTLKYTNATASGKGSSLNFSSDLGHALAGDTIYVAIGSNSNHFYDAFRLDYNVTLATPEPATLVSAAMAGLFGLGTSWRKRKAKATA